MTVPNLRGHASDHPKFLELSRMLLACSRESFTGSLQVEWKQGIPQLVKRTQTTVLAPSHGRPPLTPGP